MQKVSTNHGSPDFAVPKGNGYSQVQYLQIKTMSQVQYEEGGGREGGEVGVGEDGREWEAEG